MKQEILEKKFWIVENYLVNGMILSLMQNGQARRDFLKCGLTENCFIISLAEQLSPKMEQCLNLVFIEEKFILEMPKEHTLSTMTKFVMQKNLVKN